MDKNRDRHMRTFYDISTFIMGLVVAVMWFRVFDERAQKLLSEKGKFLLDKCRRMYCRTCGGKNGKSFSGKISSSEK